MILSEETNIYDDNAIAKKIESNKASLEILQDRISSAVTKTEVETSKRKETDAKVKILSTKVTQDAEKIDNVISRADKTDTLIRLSDRGVEVGEMGPNGTYLGNRSVAGIGSFDILSAEGEKMSSFKDNGVEYYSDGKVYGRLLKNDYKYDPDSYDPVEDGHGMSIVSQNGPYYAAVNTKSTVPDGHDAPGMGDREAFSSFSNIARSYDKDPETATTIDNREESACISGTSTKYSNGSYASEITLNASGIGNGAAQIQLTDHSALNDGINFPMISMNVGKSSIGAELKIFEDHVDVSGDFNVSRNIQVKGDVIADNNMQVAYDLIMSNNLGKFILSTSEFTETHETHGALRHKNGVVVVGENLENYKPVYASDFVNSSSRVAKENIKDETEESARRILDLRIVSYDYKEGFVDEKSRHNNRGVIAEEVVEIMPETVRIPDGWNEAAYEGGIFVPSVDYTKFIPDLIKMVQLQEDEIKSLRKELELLKTEKGGDEND